MELYLLQLAVGVAIGCVLGRKELKKVIKTYKSKINK